MEYRSDKWRTLSPAASKMGPNLLICSCQLCFCVLSNPGLLTGRDCKLLRSTFQPLSKHESIFLCIAVQRTRTAATHFLDASILFIPLSSPALPSLPDLLSTHSYLISRMFILCFLQIVQTVAGACHVFSQLLVKHVSIFSSTG